MSSSAAPDPGGGTGVETKIILELKNREFKPKDADSLVRDILS